jgi:hypothetical protein
MNHGLLATRTASSAVTAPVAARYDGEERMEGMLRARHRGAKLLVVLMGSEDGRDDGNNSGCRSSSSAMAVGMAMVPFVDEIGQRRGVAGAAKDGEDDAALASDGGGGTARA